MDLKFEAFLNFGMVEDLDLSNLSLKYSHGFVC